LHEEAGIQAPFAQEAKPDEIHCWLGGEKIHSSYQQQTRSTIGEKKKKKKKKKWVGLTYLYRARVRSMTL